MDCARFDSIRRPKGPGLGGVPLLAMDITTMGLFSAIVNEFAIGEITERPWGVAQSNTGSERLSSWRL